MQRIPDRIIPAQSTPKDTDKTAVAVQPELRFDGVIFSDDLSMAGAEAGGTIPERAALALEGGAEMVRLGNNRPEAGGLLESLEGYQNTTAASRLEIMRADRGKYAQAPYGESVWQALAGEVQALGESLAHG